MYTYFYYSNLFDTQKMTLLAFLSLEKNVNTEYFSRYTESTSLTVPML